MMIVQANKPIRERVAEAVDRNRAKQKAGTGADSVTCIAWVGALEQAWAALAALKQHRAHLKEPELMQDVERTMHALDCRLTERGSAPNEKLSHDSAREGAQNG